MRDPAPETQAAACDAPVTAILATYLADVSHDTLPTVVCDHAKASLLDTLGVARIGATSGDGHQAAVTAMTAGGGAPQATIWFTGKRIDAARAAFCNTVHARAHDYDDIMVYPQVHVSVCTVPPALAAAEFAAGATGAVTGRRLLEAIAAGAEMQSRLAHAYGPFHDASRFPIMLPTQIFGYFAAAAAAGRAMGLDAARMQSALGFAQMQAGGTEEMVVHATDSVGKCLYAGFASQAGVQAAILAHHGALARGRALEGKAGLFAAFFGGNFDASALIDGLGRDYRSLERCTKAMPGTLVAHGYVEAGRSLMRSHDLSPDDVAEVEIVVGPWGLAMSEPATDRRAPATASTAMNSIPFLLAKGLVNGKVELADMTPEGRSEPRALDMARRIRHRLVPEMAAPGGLEAAQVALLLHDGTRLEAACAAPLGHPSRPLGFDDISRKFHANMAPDGLPADRARAERISDMVAHLEDLPDIAPLLDLLPSGDRCKNGE